MSDLGQAKSESRTEGGPYPAALAGATTEIKELFSALSGELHSAERRYSEAMAEMEKRLAHIEKRAAAAARPQAAGPESWDSESAEALAQAYESQDPGFVGQSPASGPNSVLGPRLAGISSRIKRSLGEMRPQNALPAIEQRFDSFEQRIGAAVRDFARRSDVEGLQLVEQNVRELGNRLDIVQTQLTRLDRIETQLNGVMDRLSDERLAEMLAQDGRFAASLETVARLAA
jgi:hypothetical protein